MKSDLVKRREAMQAEIKNVVDSFNMVSDDHYVYDVILRTSTHNDLRTGKKVVYSTEVEVKIILL